MPEDPAPKIVFFSVNLYPAALGRPSGYGGAETELWNLVRGYTESGAARVVGVTVTEEATGPIQAGDVHLHAIPPTPPLSYDQSWLSRRLKITGYYWRLLRGLMKQRADIYYVNLASVEMAFVWLAARLVGGRFVFRVASDWETNRDELTNIVFHGSRFRARLFLALLRRANLVIAQTSKQRAELKQHFGIDSVIIPNAHFIPADEEISAGPDHRQRVLWVGRTHPLKRPKLFLDLARLCPDQHFTMIMPPGTPEHAGLFSGIRDEAQAIPNLEFIDGVAPDTIDTYYRSARLFLLTSEAEGFPNVIIEALKNGTPVISLGCNPDELLAPVAGEADTPAPAVGYYVPDSVEVTSRLIHQLFKNDQLWSNCQRLARDYAKRTFDKAAVVAQYQQVFRQL